MKRLLITTALIEIAAGVATLCDPSLMVKLLVGAPLESPATVTFGRLTGAALMALGAACWFVRRDAAGHTARGVVAGLMVYDIGAVLVLGISGILTQPVGIAQWPAVALHAALTVWTIACLMRLPPAVAR
ncbi:MAG: hypothetical protein IT435_03935 [Phycisphaerales bacterium]|nr:hypothetical protein [Phycisphaerales bacterium]